MSFPAHVWQHAGICANMCAKILVCHPTGLSSHPAFTPKVLYTFEIHICGYVYQQFFSRYFRVVFQCMNILTICLSVYLLIYIWVVPMFELIEIKSTMNILVQVFCGYIIFISLGKIPKNIIARLQGRCRLNYIGNCQAIFQSGYSWFAEMNRNLVSPYSLQHIVSSVFS